jgi:hypothetical protein
MQVILYIGMIRRTNTRLHCCSIKFVYSIYEYVSKNDHKLVFIHADNKKDALLNILSFRE